MSKSKLKNIFVQGAIAPSFIAFDRELNKTLTPTDTAIAAKTKMLCEYIFSFRHASYLESPILFY